MKKWIWLGIFALIIAYSISSSVSRHIQMNKFAHELRTGDETEKVNAARELMRRDRLYDKLQEMSVEDRIQAMDFVEKVPGERTLRQSLILLKDGDEDVRDRVAESLVKIGPDHMELLIPAIRDSDANVRNGVKAALAELEEISIPYMKEAIEKPELRGHAVEVLVAIGEPSVPTLVELLETGDQDIRMASARALGLIESPEATPALIEAANDIRAVRQLAISALCTICDPRSVDVLVDVLKRDDDDGEVRARAASALSVIGGSKAITALTGSLGDFDLKVRTSAITGLQRHGDRVVGPVTAAMAGGSRDVRIAAAQVLEGIDSPNAAAALVRIAQDSDHEIRTSAARGLGIQSSVARVDVLISLLSDQEGAVGDTASVSLSRMGNAVTPNLIGVLNSHANDVAKYRAAEALARIGSPSVQALLAALDTNIETKKWVAHTLGRIGDPKTKSVLERLAKTDDPDLAWVAERALHRML